MKSAMKFSIGVLFALCAHFAAAQSYPSKPVTIITPYPPGGTTDILARLVGQKLQVSLGQPFLVDARPGAGGNVGTDYVAKRPGDGYTLLSAASGPIAINPSLYKKLPYDPQKDLVPIILAVSVPLALVVHPSIHAANVKELIALLKANPDKYNYASAGNGTPQHLSMELFKSMTGTQIVHVPYKGTGPAINDLIGGQVPMAFESMLAVLPQIKGGRLRALAVSSSKRSSTMPDTPTVAEAGVPGYESIAWYGFLAPKGTPKDIVNKLNAEMAKALDAPDVHAKLTELGSDKVHGTPEEFEEWIKSETAKWGKVVKASGATVD